MLSDSVGQAVRLADVDPVLAPNGVDRITHFQPGRSQCSLSLTLQLSEADRPDDSVRIFVAPGRLLWLRTIAESGNVSNSRGPRKF